MTSRVRLNVPPRVIESARAAQHANREALSARQAAERIRSKAEQQQAAEQRAQGLRAPAAGATAQQRQIDGGQLEFTRRKGQRIWTRRRVVDAASISVGWMLSAQRQIQNGVVMNTYSVGSASARSWFTIQYLEDYRINGATGAPISPDLNRTALFYVLPADEDLVFAYVVFPRTDPSAVYMEGVCVIQTERVYRSQSIPEFMSRHALDSAVADTQARSYVTEYLNPGLIGFGYSRNNEQDGWTRMVGGYSVRERQKSTSNVYAGLAERMGPGVATAARATQDYKNLTGNNRIPVLGYDGLTATGAGYPAIAGEFGVIEGLDVESLVPASMTGAISQPRPSTLSLIDKTILRLADRPSPPPEYLQELALGAAETNGNVTGEALNVDDFLQNEDNYLLIGYDYHGGSYCRDKLRELGINL